MELALNQIVQLRNGKNGLVVGFNGVPSHIVFENYCNPVTQYDKELCKKNPKYDIVKIADGSQLERLTEVFKSKFDIDKTLVWERG